MSFGIPTRNSVALGVQGATALSIASFFQRLVRPVKGLFSNGEQGVWYDPSDFTTLYQDSAGTTPVTAVEQPVGLMLDKSQGLVLGSDLLPATDASDWTVYAANTVADDADGSVQVTFVDNVYGANLSLSGLIPAMLNVSKTFKVTFEAKVNTGSANVRVQNFVTSTSIGAAITSTTYVSQQFIGAWDGSGGIVLDFTNLSAGEAINIRNISVRELPGNHASQTTSAKRPTLSARYNLLTYSEQFDNVYWGKTRISASANQIVAPDGTITGDKIVEDTSASSTHFIQASLAGISATNAVTTFSVFLKSGERTRGRIADLAGNFTSVFDLSAGTITPSTGTGTITPVGNGWYRLSVTSAVAITSPFTPIVNLADADGNLTYTGDGTSGIYIWGASLVPANQAYLPYQRIAAATDYDASGSFPPYLKFDAIDDAMATSSIDFSATDEMTVFAGVRKLSDASQGVVAELSATIASNNGAFLMSAPDAANATFSFDSKGTSQVDVVSGGLYPAPRTAVVTGLSDISADSLRVRVNSTRQDQDNSDQGTGNYGDYPLYIGARGGTSLYLNGQLYSLIIRGLLTDAATVDAVENYVEYKTFGAIRTVVYSDELTTADSELITTADGEQIYMTSEYV